MILSVIDTEVIEIDGLIRLDSAERHHHVHKEANAVPMACHNQGCNIGIGVDDELPSGIPRS